MINSIFSTPKKYDSNSYEDSLAILGAIVKLELGSRNNNLEDALICIAQGLETPKELLVKLANKSGATGELALAVANNPSAPVEIFEKIEANLSSQEIVELAGMENLPQPLLERLAGDVDQDVRNAVSGNANTPESVIKMIVRGDDSLSNAVELVRDINTPAATLCRFADDDNTLVRQSLAAHPNASSSVLDYLIRDDSELVRVQVASNLNTPIDALNELADDYSSDVQQAAASNPNTPISTLEELGLI
ncbi:MAG: hypothetical protein RPS47_17965 [Colwellia sp.]